MVEISGGEFFWAAAWGGGDDLNRLEWVGFISAGMGYFLCWRFHLIVLSKVGAKED